ncbi:netrin-4-like [Gadus macrocephalus]|uniref:netrin-4-like n=1 Tax=Gadus macrocephalus TaxID=80720 RepID=UPI0028CB1F15|nr:netrin-4-like [Gadus macrocephalus]
MTALESYPPARSVLSPRSVWLAIQWARCPSPRPATPPATPPMATASCKPGVGGAQCDRCMVGYWGFHAYGCRPCDCAGGCDPFTGDCVLSPDLYNLEGNSSEHGRIFRPEELFSALHYSEKCECKEQTLTNHKLFCAMNYAYGENSFNTNTAEHGHQLAILTP